MSTAKTLKELLERNLLDATMESTVVIETDNQEVEVVDVAEVDGGDESITDLIDSLSDLPSSDDDLEDHLDEEVESFSTICEILEALTEFCEEQDGDEYAQIASLASELCDALTAHLESYDDSVESDQQDD